MVSAQLRHRSVTRADASGRRLALAFALAAALHVVAIGAFVRLPATHGREPNPNAEIVTLAFRQKPTPAPILATTPSPTPQPTAVPPTPVPHAARHVSVKAAALHRVRAGGFARRVAQAAPGRGVPAPRYAATAPGNEAPAGSGDGVGIGKDGGASAGGAGDGGSSDGSAAAPCGVVVINETGTQPLPNGGHTASIRIDVSMSDGSVVSDDLGWPFVYARDADDPFTPAGEAAKTPILLQLPPPGYSLARQKPATAFAVAHTDRDGYSDLKDCP